ncbi:tegument protein UL37 [Saimiriine betaherpesvirus 4]|uniref:Tegument protein UL37 n=1 Tax=Saimiriine betaherpesvirus 4 TaxID=1535247 RepID=G8XSW1_9BETA|nr:tegument protein UL37 [Saimiriine betaherpesvirus 4]AEV80907.1 tegument protein UL37 [Saimiriine betaherpesvirus 4]
MSRRLVDLNKITEELRTKNLDAQGALTTISKIEIAAIDVREITASKIRQFLQYIPNKGYHFNFIQKNVVYYLLSHATLSRNSDPLTLVADLVSELEKYVQRNSGNSPYEWLNNQKTLEQFKTFIAEILKIQESFSSNKFLKATLDDKASKKDLSDNGTQYLIRNVLTQVTKTVTEIRALINCRLVAELVDYLYRTTTNWFRETLQYTTFRKNNDQDLDTVLKMIYFYTYHRRANSFLETAFNEFTNEGRQRFKIFTISNLDGDQQTGAEYIRDTSFKMFNACLSDKDSSGLLFPIISTQLSVLNFMSIENLFFHPGLVYRLINGVIATRIGDKLDVLSKFLTATTDRVFRSTVSTKSNGLKDITENISKLTELGLNYETSRLYIQMCLTKQTPEKNDQITPYLLDQVKELSNQICLIVYNAYLFFLCLNVYSPTFLFNHRRRILLEQQKSLLVGSRTDLDSIWKNVVMNVNYYFPAWFTEDEFDVCTKGSTPIEKEYLYRDLINKWGDVLFTLKYRHSSEPAQIEQSTQTITITDIIERCAMVNLSDVPYESLLPLSSHPNFAEKFVNLVIVPEFTQTLNIPYAQFKTVGAPRLMQIIQACRLLMPGQMTLYHKLVALYNLTNFVSKIDGGVFRTIYDLIVEITAILENLCQESLSLNVDLIAELMAESLSNNLRDDVNPIIDEVIRNSSSSMQQYVEHTRLCYAIAMTDGRLVTKENSPDTVLIILASKTILTMSLRNFVTAADHLVKQAKNLNDNLTLTQNRMKRIWRRVNQILDDMTCAGQCAQTHPIYGEMIKSLRKTLKTLKGIEHRLSQALEQSEKSNKLVTSSLSRIIKTCSVLGNNNIFEHGLSNCITEAVGTIKSHRTFSRLPISSYSEHLPNAEELLHKFFQPYRNTSSTSQIIDMSSVTDVSNEFQYQDVFENRYSPLDNLDKLLNWYVNTKEQAQEDICASLRPTLTKCVETPS